MNSLQLADTKIQNSLGSCCVFYGDDVIASAEYESDALIRWIWVEPKYRQQGLARMMLAEIERRTGRVAHPLPPVSALAQPLFK
jgi:ribosomal protein S18 acetylase RimI-like enzyme